MIKVIEEDGLDLKLDSNMEWLYIYQNQFGHDILPDIMPVMAAVLNLMEGMVEAGTTIQDAATLVRGLFAGGKATDALIELAGLRMTDIINIVWSLAKTADQSIEPPQRWIRQFERFPLDVIVPEVFMMVANASMSSKNCTRLQRAAKDLQAKTKDEKKEAQA